MSILLIQSWWWLFHCVSNDIVDANKAPQIHKRFLQVVKEIYEVWSCGYLFTQPAKFEQQRAAFLVEYLKLLTMLKAMFFWASYTLPYTCKDRYTDIGVFSHIQYVIVHIAVITTSCFVELREIIYITIKHASPYKGQFVNCLSNQHIATMFQRRYNVVTQPRRRHAIASKPCDPQPRFDSRRRYVIWKCSSFPFGGFSLGSLRKTTNTNLRAYVGLSYILVSQFWSETDHLMTCFAAWLILTHHPSHEVVVTCQRFAVQVPFGGFSLGSLRKTTNTNLRAYVRLSYILVSEFWSETDHLMTCFAAWLILTHHLSHEVVVTCQRFAVQVRYL